MKKSICLILVFLLAAMSVCVLTSCNSDEETDNLVIYNWADYLYPDGLDDFKDYYKQVTGKNIEITYVTFDTPETLITKITKGDSNIDVMSPSEYAIQKLMVDDWLIPLNYFSGESNYIDVTNLTGYVHNADNVEENIIAKISEGFSNLTCTRKDKTTYTASMIDYMVPYMYGTLGILYNRAAFNRLGITAEQMNKSNWGILFNDDGDGGLLHEKLTGSILMKDSIRDSYAATLFYMVESGKLDGFVNENGVAYTEMSASELINCVDDNTLEMCKKVLSEQKSQLFGYEVDFGKDDLLKGNAMVDLAWSGDAMYAVEESWTTHFDDDNDGNCDMCLNSMSELDPEEGEYELAYYVPHTYGNIWFDGWVVPKTYNKEHLTAIKLFINFLNTPSVAAANMYEIGYTPAVKGQVVRDDLDSRRTLTQLYYVNAPEYYQFTEEELAENDGYSYDSWDEFAEELFESIDDYDNSNWRYPFASAALNVGTNRSIDSLGMMRDFGNKNAAVVTMWNYARSTGVNVWPAVMWTAIAVAVIVGAVGLVMFIKNRQKKLIVVNGKQ